MKNNHLNHIIMKPIFMTLLLGVAAAMSTACSSDEPSWDKSWDESWDEDIIKQAEGHFAVPDTHIAGLDVILNGEYVDYSNDVLDALREEAARPAKYPVEVRVSAQDMLKNEIGRHALEMDSLTVSGPLSKNDIRYIRLCVCSGKLRKVNLAKASLPDNTLPVGAFFGSEYYAAKVPLLTLVLPENIEKLGKCSLYQSMITEIELPERIILEDGCLASTPLLGGEITIGKDAVLDDSNPCSTVFSKAGDGTLIINYARRIVDNAFTNAKIKEFRMAEGVEEIAPDALCNLNVESLTLPKSIKKIGVRSMQNLTNLKCLHINFTDASVIGFFESEIYDKIEADMLDEWFDDMPFSKSNHDATVYVPNGTKENFAQCMPLRPFSTIVESDK